jgi:bifunctional UDP-N-acetylglucosamine pyrophosphorylase/glucosamine-1-phosphate N-acetyltransferase
VVYPIGKEEDIPSSSPAVMQQLSGRPVLLHTLKSVREATGNPATLIVDQELEPLLEQIFPEDVLAQIPEQSGLIKVIETALEGNAEHLLMVPANMPLLKAAAIVQLKAEHLVPRDPDQSQPVVTVASHQQPGSSHQFRIIRGDKQQVVAITDQKNGLKHKPEQREYSIGIYCVSANWLREVMSQIPETPTIGDLLPNLVQAASSAGLFVQSFELADPDQALSINSLIDLSKAETIMRLLTNEDLMRGGVTIIDPHTTYIDAGIEVGQDTVIHPNTYLRGDSRIGKGCQIGPNSMITDTKIGDRCEVTFSVTESAVLEDEVDIGPFAHLRKGAHLAQGVHMGNYGEVKNSYLGPGTKMGHFSYIGDANIGPEVNIGAGVITANYDGSSKHPTEIGAGAFIGSDTMLIAPIKIGAGARTGAGSVVNKDIPPNSLAVGIPARIIRKIEENDGC